MGSIIFAVTQMQKPKGLSQPGIPVPTIKPAPVATPQTRTHQFHLDLSAPKDAGNYRRLSVDDFLVNVSPEIDVREVTLQISVQDTPPQPRAIKYPRTTRDDRAASELETLIQLDNIQLSTAEAINLPSLSKIDDTRFVDRVVDMAEASPIQPDSRECGTLNQNFKSAPKYAKVRSLAMERKITKRASIGVEYVYKDGCYKKAITPLGALNMPGDDGVNLRVNMKF